MARSTSRRRTRRRRRRTTASQSNAQVDVSPIVSALSGESFLGAGALKESAEANQDGSSYGCAGVVSPGGDIQVGSAGQTCTVTGTGTGGVTLDLGALPGLGGLATLAGGDIKITIDAVTAHGQVSGTGPAVLDASVANVVVQLGTGTPISVHRARRQEPGPARGRPHRAERRSWACAGTAVSTLLNGVVSLTTNYQPAPEPSAPGVYSVSGLHVALLGGGLAVADLAKVTVGPNTTPAAVDSFSFQDLPVILGALAILALLYLGIRTGAAPHAAHGVTRPGRHDMYGARGGGALRRWRRSGRHRRAHRRHVFLALLLVVAGLLVLRSSTLRRRDS